MQNNIASIGKLNGLVGGDACFAAERDDALSAARSFACLLERVGAAVGLDGIFDDSERLSRVRRPAPRQAASAPPHITTSTPMVRISSSANRGRWSPPFVVPCPRKPAHSALSTVGCRKANGCASAGWCGPFVREGELIMQQFTRTLTREIEVAGERLALTLSKEGLSVRPVGGRRPPYNMSWEAWLCACVAGASARNQRRSRFRKRSSRCAPALPKRPRKADTRNQPPRADAPSKRGPRRRRRPWRQDDDSAGASRSMVGNAPRAFPTSSAARCDDGGLRCLDRGAG